MKPSRLQSWREKVTGGWLSKHILEIRGVFSMAAKADTLKKPVKGEKLLSSRHTKTSINDNCRLCSCLFGERIHCEDHTLSIAGG